MHLLYIRKQITLISSISGYIVQAESPNVWKKG